VGFTPESPDRRLYEAFMVKPPARGLGADFTPKSPDRGL